MSALADIISLGICRTRFNNIELLRGVICLTFCFSISLSGLNFVLQGEQVFFIVTNYIETPNQRLGFCAEVRRGMS